MRAKSDTFTHFRACHLCEATCGLEVVVEAGRIATIRGDKQDSFSQGYLCPKGNALQDIHTDPDRLRYPVRRTASGWERIEWETALDLVADNIVRIQRRYGDDALAVYWGNPPTHQHGMILTMLPFFQALRTRNRYSATSADQLPQYMTSYFMFGNQVLFPIADVDRTDFLLIMGANPLVSNGSITAAPNMRGRLQSIRQRGGRVVVVDPRYTESAEVAGEHHFIQPGTDVLLLLGMLHTIFDERLANLDHLAPFVKGLEQVIALVAPFAPERVAMRTGISAETTRQLARDFAAAPSAVCYGRLGVSQQSFGALCHWLINTLNIVTGNLDRPGGAMFTRPAFDLRQLATLITGGGHYDRWRSRVRGLPEFGDELPVATMADEMLTPGPGQVKALLLLAGNPVLTTPDGKRLEKAIGELDFVASIDFYVNESNRHADVILPPQSPLAHGNYEAAIHAVQVRNTARYSPALFTPPPGTKADWEIIVELHARVLMRRPFGRLPGRLWRALLRRVTPDHILDLGIRIGPHGFRKRGWRKGLTLKRIKQAKHGLDLGPLQPCLPEILYTPDKRINLAPAPYAADLARVRETFLTEDAPPPKQLRLIGRRHLRDNNSWMHNSYRLLKGSNRCTVLMHPEDAAAHRLEDGQHVRVSSRVGAIELPVTVTDKMMPGVVSIPHGWGHGYPGVSWQLAETKSGVSVNDITDPALVDELSGNAALNGVPVTIQPVEGV